MVSTPVNWDEVERCLEKNDASLLVFESHRTLERVETMGDLYAPVLEMKQHLPPVEALHDLAVKLGAGPSANMKRATARTSAAQERKLGHGARRPESKRAA